MNFYLALKIASQTCGTLRELIPERSYSFDYNTTVKEARNEISRGFCPRLLWWSIFMPKEHVAYKKRL